MRARNLSLWPTWQQREGPCKNYPKSEGAMRNLAVLSIMLIALGLGSCTREDSDSAAREAGRNTEKLKEDADSAARKAGKTAHELAIESQEAARKAARKLDEMGRQAREGWNEARDKRDKDTK